MDNLSHLFITCFAALLPIANPLGNAAIFLSITDGDKVEQRHKLAAKGSLYMLIILMSFLLAGSFILHFFGLSLEGIRIAGGLIIAKTAFNLLSPKTEDTHSQEEHHEAKAKDDISFSPLAMPLLAGPGAIASVMGTTSLVSGWNVPAYLTLSAAILLVCLICWLVLHNSELILKFLGVNGANALTKIMGFILLCMGVQLVINGVLPLIPTS